MLNRRGFLKGIFGAVALIAAAPALRVRAAEAPQDASRPSPKAYAGSGGSQNVELGFRPSRVRIIGAERSATGKTLVVRKYQPIIKAESAEGLPPGTLTYYPADKPVPDGWILCDGREVPKGLYPGLENVLRTCGPVSFPYGDSVWSYNVPDFRGRAYT